MDTLLAIASKREVRNYADRPIDSEVVRLILEAGRIAGSAANHQPWDFFVVESDDARARLADCVYTPSNVRGAGLVVIIAIRGRRQAGFDTGRVAQNMMLAAWSQGIGSCPNGMPDPEQVRALLDLDQDQDPTIVLTFGPPGTSEEPRGAYGARVVRARRPSAPRRACQARLISPSASSSAKRSTTWYARSADARCARYPAP